MKLLFTTLITLLTFTLNAQILTKDLFFHVPFTKNFEEVADNNSDNNYGAMLVQGTHLQDSTAIALDGINDWIDYGTGMDMDDIEDFTASCWVKVGKINSGSGRKTLFGNAGGGYGFRMYQEDDELHFTVSSLTGTDDCYYQIKSTDEDKWLHVVGVSESSALKIYVNGVLVKSVTPNNSSRKLGIINFEIGRGSQNNKNYWEGSLDELRLYNRSFTKSEVKQLYIAERDLELVCYETIYDTVTTEVFDTVVIEEKIYDTVTTTVYAYDTVTVEDTLNIFFSTGDINYSKHELKLYPNPTGSVLNIEVGDYSKVNTFNFSITNTLGQTVWSSLANANSFQVNVSDFNGTGLFFFNVYDDQAKLIERKSIVVY